eukprot:g1887.t1
MSGANFQLQHRLIGHQSSVSSLRFDPTYGRLLLSASSDGTVKGWNHETEECLFTGKGHDGGLNDVCWVGKEKMFCTASDDKTVGIWDVETQTLINRCTGHTNYVFSVKSNPPGNMIVSGGFDETVRTWDVRTATCCREIPAHSDPITCVDVSPDSNFIASSSYDGLCRIWSIQNGQAIQTMTDNACTPVSSVRFVPNGRYIIIGTINGPITLKEVISKEVKRTFEGHKNETFCLIPGLTYAAGSGGCNWLVCGSEDHSIIVWDIQRSKKTVSLADPKLQPSCPYAQKIPGRMKASHSGDGHCDAVLCIDAHPRTPTIASGSKENDTTIRIWTDIIRT